MSKEIVKGEYLVGGGVGCNGVVIYKKSDIIDDEYLLDRKCNIEIMNGYHLKKCGNVCEKRDCIYASDEAIKFRAYTPADNSFRFLGQLASINGVAVPTYLRYPPINECICNMCDLEELHILQSALYPKCMFNLPNLKRLSAGIIENDFREFTDMFKYKLEYLRLDGSFRITEKVPSEIGEFKKLKSLDIINHYYYYDEKLILPESIGDLENLESLNLKNNFGLKKLPESIGKLKKLKFLILHQTFHLTSLPDSIKDLADTLQFIDISRSGLKASYVRKLLPKTHIFS